jgi:pimeloyl-[acyl-carrier protein] synthase
MSDTLLWRPADEANIENPFAMYQQLRLQDPVHFAQTKEIIITKYEDVKGILKNNRFQTGNTLEWVKRGITYFNQKGEDLHNIFDAINSFILLLNPPQHTQIRNFVSRAWNNKDVDAIICNNVNKTLDTLGLEFDAVADFADQLTVLNISDVLGVDGKEYIYLRDLSTDLLRSLELYPSMRELLQINRASKDFIDFFREHIFVKSKSPDDGLLSKMIERNKAESLGLTEEQLISLAIFLFISGQATTSALIGNGIYAMLTHPTELEKFNNNKEMTESAVEEIIRYLSPVQMLGRIATEEIELRGKKIKNGASVILVIGSANHDEDVFTDPAKFLIDRQPNRHLGFGTGIHFCMGDWLARRQAQIGLPIFFNDFPLVSICTEKVTWNKTVGVRSLQSLPLRFEGLSQPS